MTIGSTSLPYLLPLIGTVSSREERTSRQKVTTNRLSSGTRTVSHAGEPQSEACSLPFRKREKALAYIINVTPETQ